MGCDCEDCKKREAEYKISLSKKQLEDAVKCAVKCDKCCLASKGAYQSECVKLLAQTALSYQQALEKVLKVLEDQISLFSKLSVSSQMTFRTFLHATQEGFEIIDKLLGEREG